MTTDLALQPAHAALPSKTEFDTMMSMANAVAASEFVPKGLRGNAGATLAAIMFGREIGLPPMVAMSSVYIIEGHPTMSAHLLMALIRRGGKILETSSTTTMAKIKAQRKDDGETMEVSYTIDEARAAKLSEKDNWRKYPADMLWARCVSRLYRRLFSDVAFGAAMYTPEDFDITDAEAGEATTFTDEQIAEVGVMAALSGFVPRPEDGKPMTELVKKEILLKVRKDENLITTPWSELTDAAKTVAISKAQDAYHQACAALGIPNTDTLDFDQATAIFNLVRDGTMPAVEEAVEGEIVETDATEGAENAPTPQSEDVVDAEVVEPKTFGGVDAALAEQRWIELSAHLELDLSGGTNAVIEARIRKLYRLMTQLGLWADDQFHTDIAAAKPGAKHYADLGKKEDFQRFAAAAQVRAKRRFYEEGDSE